MSNDGKAIFCKIINSPVYTAYKNNKNLYHYIIDDMFFYFSNPDL